MFRRIDINLVSMFQQIPFLVVQVHVGTMHRTKIQSDEHIYLHKTTKPFCMITWAAAHDWKTTYRYSLSPDNPRNETDTPEVPFQF